MGAMILFLYGIVSTFQPAHFGRVYVAYGGIFIVYSLIWSFYVYQKRPDKYEIVGALIALVGVLVMFYIFR